MAREFKDSGIEWIGQIPKEWKVIKLKHESQFINGYAYDSNDFKLEGDVRVVRIGDIGLSIDWNNCIYVNNSAILLDDYKICNGDILIAMSGATTGKCCLATNIKEAYINQRVGIIRSEKRKLVFFSLLAPYFKEYVNLNNAGSAQPNISSKAIGEFPLVMPKSLSEQQKIVDYLDKVCGEVEEMVAIQETMIEELKAYKQSVITEAVTKGLNPNVPMRDSGIDWIGEIPEHWEFVHFSKTNWIRARLGWKGLKADEYTETGYPFLSAFNIVNDNLDWSNLNFINKERYDESPEIKLSLGDLLLVKDGAGIGKCAVVEELPYGESTVNSSIAVVTPIDNSIVPKFQYYYFKSQIFQNTIWLLKIGMGVPHLTQENMKGIVLPCPSIEEQHAIASYLDTKCSEIDSLIALKQAKIEELKEYKKSVIYEYVTGKKEVV